ncbi:PEP-CTERM sorting domain-containing protein [Methylomonas koyamae]|uniref:PEP-CTERM sorting domain-containing protein n=1 Tax=Methylomonas koyamae TaxID=702114 RepID=UPI000ACF0999|nr:PEP-CTERM sorting domain-containing protein [Methylomonas koyamae]BBL60169.1 hypothetical protein MKFW12EY_37820 [Methylomonas koyamae]
MKKLYGLLAVYLFSSAANAAVQFSFGGHLITESTSYHIGDTFSGQFTLNPDTPDLSAYQTPPNVSTPRIELTYLNNASSSIAVNGGVAKQGNDKIEVHFENDLELTQAMINSVGLQGRINPGIYDTADISDTHIADDNSATNFMVLVLFSADSFTATHIENQDYAGILDLDLSPSFAAIRIRNRNSSEPAATGVLDHYSITAVPLPASLWLFGSALAGLVLKRKRGIA